MKQLSEVILEVIRDFAPETPMGQALKIANESEARWSRSSDWAGQVEADVDMRDGRLTASFLARNPDLVDPYGHEAEAAAVEQSAGGAVDMTVNATLAAMLSLNCQKERMKAGLAYPRSCQLCGLGPCKRGHAHDWPMNETVSAPATTQ